MNGPTALLMPVLSAALCLPWLYPFAGYPRSLRLPVAEPWVANPG